MKEVFNFFAQFLKRAWKKEIGSSSGKINLSGGIFITIIVILGFVEGIGVKIINVILAIFNKPQLSEVPPFYIFLSIIVLAIYFLFCLAIVEESD